VIQFDILAEGMLGTILQGLVQMWYLFPIALVLVLVRTARFKGKVGEFSVRLAIRYLLNRRRYWALHDVTIPTETGTTQIDHIIVSQYGVFVIETKNMKGWIFGQTRDAQWTQKIYRHTSRFQNPLRQNYKHTESLKSMLGLSADQVHSLVVFVGDATFKTKMPSNVQKGLGFVRYIKGFREPILSNQNVSMIVDQIESGRLKRSAATNRAHIQNLTTERKQKVMDAGLGGWDPCHRCGGAMVIRTVKKGDNKGTQFLGCENFPRCRARRKLVAEH